MNDSLRYDSFEQTGAETPAGKYLRRFWHPVFVAKDLERARAVPLRVMGDEYVLYRGEDGEPHLLDGRCAHRKVLLSIGMIEKNCVRCRYHGWKYDSNGQCIEQPAETRGGFAHKVKLGSYPVREYFGLVWAYVGPERPAPPPPRWPMLERAHPKFRVATSELRPFNFFADLENIVDDSHLGFVHARSVYHDRDFAGQPTALTAVETEYGMLHETTFANDRVKQYMLLMPNCVFFRSSASKVRGLDGLIWVVPNDDVSHTIFFFVTAPADVPIAELFGIVAARRLRNLAWRIKSGRLFSKGDEVGEVISGKRRFDDMRPDGMLEDHVVLAAQGATTDRSKHWLGTSDVAVILLRKLWSREMKALAEGKPLTPFVIPEGLRPR